MRISPYSPTCSAEDLPANPCSYGKRRRRGGKGHRIASATTALHTVGHKHVNALVNVRRHASRRPRDSHRSGRITCVRQHRLVARYPNARLQAEQAECLGARPRGSLHRGDGREATPAGVFRPLIRSVVPIYRYVRRPIRRHPEPIYNRPYHVHRSVGEDEARPPVERESRRVA